MSIHTVNVFGEEIDVLVTDEGYGMYLGREVEYDLGRPSCCGYSVEQVLAEMQDLLEERHLREVRPRDVEFARIVAGAEVP